MKRAFFLAIAFSLVFACTREKEREGIPANKKGEALLAVGNRVVTLGEFYKDLERAKLERGISEDSAALAVLKETLIRETIRTELILHVARKKGITVSHDEVAAEIGRIRESYPGDTFREMLAEQYIAYDTWVDRQKTRLTVEKVVREEVRAHVTVSDEEIRAFYDEHAEMASEPAQVSVLQILVATEDEARRLRARIKHGEDFGAIAAEKSISPEAREGGKLGVFSVGQLPLSFNVVFSLGEGQVSDVVQTEFGFHIFKVDKKIPARTLTADDAREKITAAVQARKSAAAFKLWLEGLAKTTPVMRNDALLAAIE